MRERGSDKASRILLHSQLANVQCVRMTGDASSFFKICLTVKSALWNIVDEFC